MDGEIVVAVKLASEKKWKDFWEERRQLVLAQVIGTPDADLPKLKARIAEINVLEQAFLEALKK